MPVPLDEYPVHQAPVSMRYFDTSDRNVYDRCIFQAFERSGEVELLTGLGVYPHLGVIDGYATVRRGNRQVAVRTSDALGDDRMDQRVGPLRINVLEPLQKLRVRCDADEHGVAFDLTWDAAFPAVEEPRHVHRQGSRLILDACRFVQVGSWRGVVRIEGEELPVDDEGWSGTRDRSWGIRPVGEAEPLGRPADGAGGFWWCWAPLRFEEFAIVVIVQEGPDGHRVLNEAVRVWPAGSGRAPEQLGWPEIEIFYRSGTRHPERATIHLTERGGKPVTVDVETRGFVPLHVGPGYGGDPDWSHGQWRGPGWVEGAVYELTDPAIAGRIPYGVIDHVARATCDGAEGFGIFEHASIGRHDPSGFAELTDVAP
ncbi:MAG: hypothetical protein ACRDY6_01840 [Acidimicrobiia bacterium]